MDDSVSKNAGISLQQIIDEERTKRVEAEKTAQALIEEFTSCSDFDEVRAKFRDKIKEIAPMALTNIVRLMNTADSESVQANLNKWVLEWAMSEKIDGSNGELTTLMKALQRNDSTTEPTQT